MADIEKALDKLNKKKEPTDPKTKLPAYYHDKIDMKIFTLEVIWKKMNTVERKKYPTDHCIT
ncbi:hypothetical protein PTT_16014 [Pyrenophora teres f. teres 0-1]|uniref:Uncharacterized protein n=1 Tax=Pyrenophora teres f. teres (strain 0-1) TaxID=861557 RepID=E3S1D8_PYRTT|nr:hypothetical protein PTT_16014 [Pyrenophora teres f. teres 0-1]